MYYHIVVSHDGLDTGLCVRTTGVYQGNKAARHGRAFVAIADDQNAVFYNLQGLPRGRGNVHTL